MKENMSLKLFVILALFLSGCADTIHLKHMEVESYTQFMNKYIWVALKDKNGNIVSGSEKIIVCDGYYKPFSSAAQGAVVLGAAALLGPAGLAQSGDRSNTVNNNRASATGGDSSSISGAYSNSNSNSNSFSGANSISGASVKTPMKTHH